MKIRLVLSTVISVLVVLGLGIMPRFAPVQASVSQQAAAAHAPSAAAMALVALETSTAATLAATATSTAATSAATPTATAVPATATAVAPTATGIPLAAYPAPVNSAIATRVGGSLVFRWSLMTQKGVKGFNLYAGKHKLNTRLIRTHKSLSYHKTVSYRPGKRSIRVLMRSGGYVKVTLP